ncbi:Protein of unknown function [Actinomadura meyerae]|jgi:hypothetical protein|uniref:DUF3263 domain-containing protein n=1 Tax=Actinomadura meyerae TaxID=240840 RepID=A0A239P4S9_9ACTN|nr:Protein of unknown function [Actinomadura meyerae]
MDDGRPPRPLTDDAPLGGGPGDGLDGESAGELDDEGGADAAAFPAGRLSDRERRILAFERQWWKYAGAKEQAIRELFDMSATRYYQLLNILIDRPEALECDPMLVKRLRRMRSQRQRSRAARRLGIRP